MFDWFNNPFREAVQREHALPNRAQRRATEQEKRRQKRRGERAYQRSQRER